jgi:ATP-dependent DNA ligase
MAIAPIIPTIRREPFDDPQWSFELKFDGFRGIADTVNGRMLSKRGNRMKRFEDLIATLPVGCILG